MSTTLGSFLVLALSISVFHTLLGPDHYLPFIVLSRSRSWTLKKTLWITFLCGLGHVFSSVALGALGIGFGWAVGKVVSIEGLRGDIAGWLLLTFGCLYTIWGLRQGLLNKTHSHCHAHHNHHHDHEHGHDHDHFHVHDHESKPASMTPWVLFLIFVFGPCEPLIPVLMYPAVQHDSLTLIGVVSVFTLGTLITMLSVVTLSYRGLQFVNLQSLERWTHALAGGAITVVSAGMVFLGW